jgi:hypothetical protein
MLELTIPLEETYHLIPKRCIPPLPASDDGDVVVVVVAGAAAVVVDLVCIDVLILSLVVCSPSLIMRD